MDERNSGRNSDRSGDRKDVGGSELRAVEDVDFGRVTGYVTRVRETEFRSARVTRGLICRVSD